MIRMMMRVMKSASGKDTTRSGTGRIGITRDGREERCGDECEDITKREDITEKEDVQ